MLQRTDNEDPKIRFLQHKQHNLIIVIVSMILIPPGYLHDSAFINSEKYLTFLRSLDDLFEDLLGGFAIARSGSLPFTLVTSANFDEKNFGPVYRLLMLAMKSMGPTDNSFFRASRGPTVD